MRLHTHTLLSALGYTGGLWSPLRGFARDTERYYALLADADSHIESGDGVHVIRMPEHYGALSPILHVVPLQLLAYHTACARGTDVDKPRNLAKSVTVE
jgi:glucosamine 6-phosphate synthetase-like amidotransferase/phosphosugar isomerase protein